MELVRQGVEEAVAWLGQLQFRKNSRTTLTITLDVTSIQAIGIEYGEFRLFRWLLAGGHFDSCSKQGRETGDFGVQVKREETRVSRSWGEIWG